MFRKSILILSLLTTILSVSSCVGDKSDKLSGAQRKPELLIYCGTTMVKPIRELADSFEREFNCRVFISQGGSEDLYQCLKFSRQGDLYLPGCEIYREKYLVEGFLDEGVYLGFNQAVFMVQQGNPLGITGDLNWLLDKDLTVVLGNPESCSIGKQTKKILTQAGISDQVTANCFTLVADSRNLNKYLKNKTADLLVNWRATAFFAENLSAMAVVDLDESLSPRKTLVLNLLTFSKQKALAREFMNYASSATGQEVFRKFGFLEDEELSRNQIRGIS